MSAEKAYLCDEYKLYFKIEDDIDILRNEMEIYNSSFVGNNCFCHQEYIDGQKTLKYSIPAMLTMEQFITKKFTEMSLWQYSSVLLTSLCILRQMTFL